MYSCGPPHMDVQEWDDQHEHTYSNYVRTQDVTLKTCRRRWMIGRNGERGSRISALAARHDDDDDDIEWLEIIHFFLLQNLNFKFCSYHSVPLSYLFLTSLLSLVFSLQKPYSFTLAPSISHLCSLFIKLNLSYFLPASLLSLFFSLHKPYSFLLTPSISPVFVLLSS